MSAHSTIKITRAAAIQHITSKIVNMTDKELEEIMDLILDERLYNCIVSDYGENEDYILN